MTAHFSNRINDANSHCVLINNCSLIDDFGWRIHGKEQLTIEAERSYELHLKFCLYWQVWQCEKNKKGSLCTPLQPIHYDLNRINVLSMIKMWLIWSITWSCRLCVRTNIKLCCVLKMIMFCFWDFFFLCQKECNFYHSLHASYFHSLIANPC